jgi:sugar/nucleoside kinase (ribokinase family)
MTTNSGEPGWDARPGGGGRPGVVAVAGEALIDLVPAGREGLFEAAPGGSPEYDFRVEGTADWQWRDAELTGAVDDQVVALHGGSLAFTMPPGADGLCRLFERARDTATVSYDPNFGPGGVMAAAREAGMVYRPGRRVAIVDTDTLSTVLDEAVLASAITCTRHGADPPTAQHLLTGIG